MVLSREAHGAAVACQVAVLQVNDSLAYQVIRSDEVTIPYLNCEILVQRQRSRHLKDAGNGRQEDLEMHLERFVVHTQAFQFKHSHCSFTQLVSRVLSWMESVKAPSYLHNIFYYKFSAL